MIALLAYLITADVHATEAFYQPMASTNAATVQAGYRSGRSNVIEDDDDRRPDTLSGLYRLGLRYERGFSDRLSLGVDAAYSNLRFKSEGTSWIAGFEPINVYLRGNAPVSNIEIVYALDVGFSVENAKLNDHGIPNRSVGDISDGINNELTLRPTLGVQTAFGDHHYGVLASYDVYKANQEISVPIENGTLTVDFKRGARSSLLGFYEFTRPDYLVGLKVDWLKQWEVKVATQYGSQVAAGFGMLHLELYGRYAFTPSLYLRPSVTYLTRALGQGDDTLEDWRWTLALRQTF